MIESLSVIPLLKNVLFKKFIFQLFQYASEQTAIYGSWHWSYFFIYSYFSATAEQNYVQVAHLFAKGCRNKLDPVTGTQGWKTLLCLYCTLATLHYNRTVQFNASLHCQLKKRHFFRPTVERGEMLDGSRNTLVAESSRDAGPSAGSTSLTSHVWGEMAGGSGVHCQRPVSRRRHWFSPTRPGQTWPPGNAGVLHPDGSGPPRCDEQEGERERDGAGVRLLDAQQRQRGWWEKSGDRWERSVRNPSRMESQPASRTRTSGSRHRSGWFRSRPGCDRRSSACRQRRLVRRGSECGCRCPERWGECAAGRGETTVS